MFENHLVSGSRRRLIQLAGMTAVLALVAAACEGGKPAVQGGTSTAAQKPASESADKSAVLATYDGKNFTLDKYKESTGRLNARARKSLNESVDRRRQFVENDILSDLIYAEGEKRGFEKDPEIRKRLDELLRHLVVQRVMEEQQNATVTDPDVRAYYDAHPQEFSTERAKASHILVDNEQLAKEIYDKLQADPSQFTALAAEHSKDLSNAKRGGDLGLFGRGRMVKEFDEAAFALTKDGEISKPVQTRFGWHVIMRTGREEGTVQPFDQVKNQIKVKMVSDLRREKTTSFLDELKKKSGLKINDDELAKAMAAEGGAEEEAPPSPH
ncbi:MAG: peptidylprolyl isomerase [Deltaproteobacteria bacterium]|nr:peptidylprolyl isomerase [Deltaproteobacteria bacterium]